MKPLVLPSGLRFIETPSVPDSDDESGKLSFIAPAAVVSVTVSPELDRWRPPIDAAIAFESPDEMD